MAAKTKEQLENELAAALEKIAALEGSNAALAAERDELAKQIGELQLTLSATGKDKPPAAPLSDADHARADIASTRSPDLPQGITEQQVRAKIAASENQLTRAEAIKILKQHQA